MFETKKRYFGAYQISLVLLLCLVFSYSNAGQQTASKEFIEIQDQNLLEKTSTNAHQLFENSNNDDAFYSIRVKRSSTHFPFLAQTGFLALPMPMTTPFVCLVMILSL